VSDIITVHHFETVVDRFAEESPNLDDLGGDWVECYAILVRPELVPIDGTCKDRLRVKKCEAGHLHMPDRVVWEGPISPVGFAEIWERKANLNGTPLARLESNLRDLAAGDTLTLGPGRLT
jgi:hypothetical protein